MGEHRVTPPIPNERLNPRMAIGPHDSYITNSIQLRKETRGRMDTSDRTWNNPLSPPVSGQLQIEHLRDISHQLHEKAFCRSDTLPAVGQSDAPM